MIKLSENRTALVNLKLTIDALDELNLLIDFYKQDKPGPAYCTFEYVDTYARKVQFDRAVIVEALIAQKERLTTYLEELGIDANS